MGSGKFVIKADSQSISIEGDQNVSVEYYFYSSSWTYKREESNKIPQMKYLDDILLRQIETTTKDNCEKVGKFGPQCTRDCQCHSTSSCGVFTGICPCSSSKEPCRCRDGRFGLDCQSKATCDAIPLTHARCASEGEKVDGAVLLYCECDEGYYRIESSPTGCPKSVVT